MAQKASFSINHAIGEYDLSKDDIVRVLETDDGELTSKEIRDKHYFKDLISNLIDFSVAEEYQALEEISNEARKDNEYEEFEEAALLLFSKYNKTYTRVEIADLIYGIGVAKVWDSIESNEIIEYRTQRDERVRDLHKAFDGVRYRKKDFPSGLVPPIEHGCRCFLVNTGSTDGRKLTNRVNVGSMIESVANKTFSSNLAETGIMFGAAHPYFEIPESRVKLLNDTSNRIKRDYGILDPRSV